MPGPNLVEIARTMPGGWLLHGQCRLIGPQPFRLIPWHGNRLLIDGAPREIPAAGVDLLPNGLIPFTAYYIFALMDGDRIVLQPFPIAASSHVTEPDIGVEVKSDDPRSTLVGMGYMGANLWQLALSWYNRQRAAASVALEAETSKTSLTYVELDSTKRVTFLTWDEAVLVLATGASKNSEAGGATYTGISFNGVDPTTSGVRQIFTISPAAGQYVPFALAGSYALNEGVNYASLFGRVGSGTGTWWGSGVEADTALEVAVAG